MLCFYDSVSSGFCLYKYGYIIQKIYKKYEYIDNIYQKPGLQTETEKMTVDFS